MFAHRHGQATCYGMTCLMLKHSVYVIYTLYLMLNSQETFCIRYVLGLHALNHQGPAILLYHVFR